MTAACLVVSRLHEFPQRLVTSVGHLPGKYSLKFPSRLPPPKRIPNYRVVGQICAGVTSPKGLGHAEQNRLASAASCHGRVPGAQSRSGRRSPWPAISAQPFGPRRQLAIFTEVCLYPSAMAKVTRSPGPRAYFGFSPSMRWQVAGSLARDGAGKGLRKEAGWKPCRRLARPAKMQSPGNRWLLLMEAIIAEALKSRGLLNP